MLSNNRYKAQHRDLIQTQGADDILVASAQGTTGKYMLSAKPGLITQRQTGARYSQEQVLDGLIGWWFLAEPIGVSYYDFSGSDATITATGPVSTTYNGVYGPVPQLDYAGGSLSVNGASAVGKFAPLTNASWAIATWVRFDSQPTSGRGAIAEFNENLTETGKAIFIYRDTVSGVITYSLYATTTSISTISVPSVGKWYHLAITYEYSHTNNNGTYKIYLDGVLENTLNTAAPFAGNLANTGSAIRVGYIASLTNYLAGALNDFRIYSRSLTASEVGYLVALKNGNLAVGLTSYSGNTSQTTRWQSGPINTNQLGDFITEIGKSAFGTPFTNGQSLQPATNSLRGHWPLSADNTFLQQDISGNQAPGTMGGTSAGIIISNPEIGAMLGFDGISDYVDMSSSAYKMSFVNTDSFTFCMWVKLNNEYNTFNNDPFFELGTSTLPVSTGSHIYAYRTSSTNYINFTFYNNQLMSQVTMDNSLNHLAFTYNRQTRVRQIWLNGQIVGEDTSVNPPLLTSITRFRIGFNTNPSSLYLAGAMSDFRVYSTALTVLEINQIIRQRVYSLFGGSQISGRGLLPACRLLMYLNDPNTVGTTPNNIQDYSGYGHLGYFFTPTTFNSVGNRSGLVFNSSLTQNMSITSTNALAITGPLTISFWIYPTSLATQMTVLSKQTYAEYEISIDTGGRILFSHGSGVFGTYTTYTTTFQVITTLNQWYYIVVTRDTGAAIGKNVKIFGNGVYYQTTKMGTSETTYTVGSLGTTLYIGSNSSSAEYANMILSDLSINALTWTINEIQANMISRSSQLGYIGSRIGIQKQNSCMPSDMLTLHLNAKDAASILGTNPQYLPDYSGQGHTANVQPVASAVSFSAGATLPGGASRSLFFNGTNGYLLCDGGMSGREYFGPSGGTARTISMWINPNSLTGTGRPIISWGAASSNTGIYGSFDAYLNSTGNLVVNLNSQTDSQISQTWLTRITTGDWQYLTLVVSPTNQPAEMIKCYTGNSTLIPSRANLISESSNLIPNELVCLLNLTEETPNGRLADASGYNNHGFFIGQRWPYLTSFIIGRMAHKQYDLYGQIYVVGGIIAGGTYTSSVEVYNGFGWSSSTSLPQERAYFGGAYYNYNMYALGGKTGTFGTETNTVIFSNGYGAWASATSMFNIRVDCGAVANGEYLYAIGGYNTGTGGNNYLSSAERFNGSSWSAIANMATARASPAVVVYNSYIYVIGGYNSVDLALRTVERYDGDSIWTYMPPMNYPRAAATAIVSGGYIYVMGGTTSVGTGTVLDTVERFDGQRWTVIGNLPQPLSYAASSVNSQNNNLIITGGTTTGSTASPSNSTYYSIKSTGNWGEPVTWMNGISSNIVIPASNTSNLASSNSHTISLWVQPRSILGGTIFSAENSSNQDLCAIRINPSGLLVYTMTNSSSVTNTVSSNSSLVANKWYHITTSYDGVDMRLYLDGQLTNTTASLGTTISGTPRDIYIGADWDVMLKDYYSGNLGECRIYKTVLSANSVSGLYNTGPLLINRSIVRTQPNSQLCIGRGFTGSIQAGNYYSGYMDDIRVYDGEAMSYPELVSIWSNGNGNYYSQTGWLQPNPNDLSSNIPSVIICSAPIPQLLPNQTFMTSNLATRPSNITPSVLVSQSMTCANLVITNPICQPYNLASNLAGWWQLDDLQPGVSSNTLIDSSGLGHTATKTGPGQSYWLVGPQNQPAIYMSGAQQTVTIKDGSTSTFPVLGSDYTLSGWFNCFSNTGGSNNAIIGISTNSDADRLIVYSAPDSNIIVSTSSANTTANIPATSNAWNHLVITGTATDSLGSNTRVYLNNYQIANTSAITTFVNNDKFYLGSKRDAAGGGTSTNYFKGLLSDFRIYNRRLQPTEIRQLYTGVNHGVIQTDTSSGVYSLTCFGTPGIGGSANSRLIKLVSPGYASIQPTPRETQRGGLGIAVRIKYDSSNPSVGTIVSTETDGSMGGWQLLLAPPKLQALKLWFSLNDGVDAVTAYNGAHTSPAYNGVYSGSGWSWTAASRAGVAPFFNGSSNYITVDNGSGLNTDTLVGNEITVCGWVNTNTIALGTRTFFGISESGTGAVVLGLSLSGGMNYLTATVGTQTVTAYGQAPYRTWCFVAMTIRSGYKLSLYLNNGGRPIGIPSTPFGADYYTLDLTESLNITDTNMIYIGAQPGNPSAINYFNGALSDFRVYNRALEPSDIETIYYNHTLPYFLMNTVAAPVAPKILVSGGTKIEADKWHNLTVNYSAGGQTGKLGCAEIWVNGELAGQGNLTDLGYTSSNLNGLSANTTANLVIGSSILGVGENPRSYLQGRVSDIRISQQPFSKEMITRLAGGWENCVLSIGSVGVNTAGNIGVNSSGVLVDMSGYSGRLDYSNQISAFGGVQINENQAIGTTMIFNGNTSYCEVTGYLAQAYHRIYAISCWITPDPTVMMSMNGHIISKWTDGSDGGSCYKLVYNSMMSFLTASVGIGSRTISLTVTVRRSLNHVLLQTTQNELMLYINGQLAGISQLATSAGASSVLNVSNNTPVRIGSDSYGSAGTFFKGSVGGIRIFEGILPLATIMDLAGASPISNDKFSADNRVPTIGYDSSRLAQINSGLLFWLPQADLSGGNIAPLSGSTYSQIRVIESSAYRAQGVASNVVVLAPNSVAVTNLGSGIQTLGSATSNLIFDGSYVLAQLAGSPSFSVAFWGKFYNTSPANKETVLSLRDPSATTANTMIEISRDATSKVVSMNFGSGAATETANTLVVADTNWHHWVITYGANTSVSNTAVAASKRNYYLDGVRVAVSSSANIGRPMLSNCGVLALGGDNYYSGAGTVAANIGLQDFRIYNRVLGVDEIGLLYNMPRADSLVAGSNGSSVGSSTPIELTPVVGGTSGYEIIELRKRRVLPNGLPVSGIAGDTNVGDLIDTIGAGSGFARDNLMCAVGANPSNINVVSDQNWQVKPAMNYRSPGYLTNPIPITTNGMSLGGGATANTDSGLAGSAGIITLGTSAGNLYISSSNVITESRDWSICLGVSASGSVFSNSALMTVQGTGGSSVYRSWWLNSSNAGELMFQVDSTGTANSTGVFIPSNGRMTHLAITKGQLYTGTTETANTVSIYQDGICKWRRVTNLNPGGAQYLTIGSSPDILSGVGFGGVVKDIQIYSSCLADGVIKGLAAHLVGTGLGTGTRPNGAPLHHWLFATATGANTVPDLGVLGCALGFSAFGVSVQYRNQGTSLESWSRVAQPGLPSDGVGYFTGAGECIAYSCPVARDGARTVAFWMRRSAIGVLGEGLVTWGTGSVSGGWFAIGLNSSGQISVRTSSTMTPRVVSTSAILDNRWYHISVVVLPSGNSSTGGIGNANNIRIFINGYHDTLAPFGTTFGSDPINTVKSSSSSSDWLYVGSHGLLNYFNGYLDDVRIYGYALTPDEVLGLARGAGQLAVVRR